MGIQILNLNKRMLWVAGGAAVGLLALGVFAILRLRKRKRKPEVSGPSELPAASSAGELPEGSAEPTATLEDQFESRMAQRDALQQKLDSQALNSLKLAPVITKTAEVLAKHLREKISKEPEVAAQVLRTWIREEEI
jgi:flagellar biosynthesis/type III secretory pathway M-ring protein FliF/YscJ